MLSAFSRIKSITISIVFLALLLGNIFFFQSEPFGLILLTFWLGYYGTLLGQAIAPQEEPGDSWWLGMLGLLSAVMIAGSCVYYAAFFSAEAAWSIGLLSIPLCLWAGSRTPKREPLFSHRMVRKHLHRIPRSVYLAATGILLCLYLLSHLLAGGAITEAVRSPWSHLPVAIFAGSFLLFTLLFALLWRGRERALSISLLSLTLALFLSVTVFVFPIGYGFDSFIHQATESHIAESGTITPKPFYYIGQYTLVVFLHHVFSLPIDRIDTLLVPLLTALFLPIALYAAAVHLLGSRERSAGVLPLLFLLPLSSFIVTTPQALANLWTLLIILASVPYMLRLEKPRIEFLFLLAAATLAIHPIAGIPAVLFVALLATDPQKTNSHLRLPATALYWVILLAGCIILPASFAANAFLSGSGLGLDLSALTPAAILSSLHIDLFLENRFSPTLDFVYLYGFNALALLFTGAGIGWYVKRKELAGRLRVLLGLLVMMLANFVILSTAVDFSFLIDYERLNYANRLVPLMAFFATPFLILFAGTLLTRLKESPLVLRGASLVLLAAVSTNAFYLTYPRDDAYETSHGFNVSASDLSAVYAIDDMAEGRPYAVLANQSVSAAAIRSIGFARYYGDLFFYPIPTGGELYEHFLRMNESPTRTQASEAALLLQDRCKEFDCATPPPERIYYVVNDYWWQSDRLIETAKSNADDWTSIDGGRVYIFEYNQIEQNPTP